MDQTTTGPGSIGGSVGTEPPTIQLDRTTAPNPWHKWLLAVTTPRMMREAPGATCGRQKLKLSRVAPTIRVNLRERTTPISLGLHYLTFTLAGFAGSTSARTPKGLLGAETPWPPGPTAFTVAV